MKPEPNTIICGDALETLKTWDDEFIDCVVTSPPYWGLRDYGVTGQIGLENTPEEYTANIVEIFREIKRVLKKDGTVWLNLGDSYAGGGFGVSKDENYNLGKQGTNRGTANFEIRKKLGSLKKNIIGIKPKDLVGIPWRVAFALQADEWYLRQDIIWAKPNPMPESVTDRCTKSHEYIFLLAKSPRYYFDNEAIKETTKGNEHDKRARKSRKRFPTKLINGIRKTGYYPMANKRSVWTISTKPYSEAHFATFPPDLIIPCVKITRPDALILDPFMGSGTTAYVARMLGRKYLGIELSETYCKLTDKRLAQQVLL